MSQRLDQAAIQQMAINLRKAIELTELGLAMRLSTLRRQKRDGTMKDVMREIRLAKEQAWRPSRS